MTVNNFRCKSQISCKFGPSSGNTCCAISIHYCLHEIQCILLIFGGIFHCRQYSPGCWNIKSRRCNSSSLSIWTRLVRRVFISELWSRKRRSGQLRIQQFGDGEDLRKKASRWTARLQDTTKYCIWRIYCRLTKQ